MLHCNHAQLCFFSFKAIKKGAPGAGKGEKDGSLSKQMRDAGNSAFTSMDDELALKCYNEVTDGSFCMIAIILQLDFKAILVFGDNFVNLNRILYNFAF